MPSSDSPLPGSCAHGHRGCGMTPTLLDACARSLLDPRSSLYPVALCAGCHCDVEVRADALELAALDAA